MPSDTSIDPNIFQWASITIAICVCMIAICATIVGAIAFRAGGDSSKTFFLLVERSGTLQLVTIMSIVTAACLLAILGKINAEGITSILSGIAGYVLGGAAYTKSQPRGAAEPASERQET